MNFRVKNHQATIFLYITSPVDLPDPGFQLGSPALHADFLPTELSGKPNVKRSAEATGWGGWGSPHRMAVSSILIK